MIEKQNFTGKVKEIFVKFDEFFKQPNPSKDENILNAKKCVETYNFITESGSLKNGYGLVDLQMNYQDATYNIAPSVTETRTEIDDIWYYSWAEADTDTVQDYIFTYTNDNNINYTELHYPQYVIPMEEPYTSHPEVIKIKQNNREKFLMSSDNEVYMLALGLETKLTDSPKVIDACYHFDKLFAIAKGKRNELIYSADDDVTKWTEDNVTRIDFFDGRGKLLKILNFNDNLYIFREFGITKIDAYSVNSVFGISHMYQSTSYIFPKTIKVCGGKIYFMTTSGMYAFNGSSVEKIDLEIIDKIDKSLTSQIVTEGYKEKYFIACRMDFKNGTIGCENEAYVNNCILIYDVNTNDIQVMRGFDVKKFAAINSLNFNKLCAAFRGSHKAQIGEFIEGGVVFGTPIEKAWSSPLSDGGYPNKLKHIRAFYIKAKQDCKVRVETELETQEYSVSGAESIQRVKANLKGTKFKITITSTSANEQCISDVKLSMAVYL